MDALYIIGPILLIAVVLAAVWLDRWSVPVILIALGAGIFFGSDVLNLWHFDDINLTNQVANLALVFILFYGGFSTKRSDFKEVALPAGGLATWGVALTAGMTFVVLWLFNNLTPQDRGHFYVLTRAALLNALSSTPHGD